MTLDLTVVAIDFITHDLTKLAIEQTLRCIDPKEVVVISDKNIYPGTTWVPCKPIRDHRIYNEMMLKWVYPLVDTSHILYIQYDGVPINKSLWSDSFLLYDYIGAPWPDKPENMNVGNGGFSLRSKKLLHACRDPRIQVLDGDKWLFFEDEAICVYGRKLLEDKYSIQFAPTRVAKLFSHEAGLDVKPTFGVHGLESLLTTVDYYIKILEGLNYNNWSEYRWACLLSVFAKSTRVDGLDLLVNKLKQLRPEYIPNIILNCINMVREKPHLQNIISRLT
jgi:hypothetical protein